MTIEDQMLADSFADVLAVAGTSAVYRRAGSGGTTVTVVRRVQQSRWVQSDNAWIEVRPVDFLMLSSVCPVDEPRDGDQIVCEGSTYVVTPTLSEKVFRQITPSILRIHTKLMR